MLDIYLIRHAESEMNKRSHLVGGQSNSAPLSPRGMRQAQFLWKRFSATSVAFDTIYCSSALRAMQTAAPCKTHINYPLENIIYSDRLRELDQGEWEGKARMQCYTPEVMAQIKADGWNFKAPGGESQKDVEERIYSYFEENIFPLDNETEGRGTHRIAIVSHAFSMKCFIRKILDFDPVHTYYMRVQNTGIIHLEYDKGLWNVLCINDLAHLYGKEMVEKQ